ncbi:MAG: hypothetical protein WC254_04880, partial [Candidatus Woesearchaeota archaeon]
MFRAKRMMKIQIVGPQTKLPSLINLLHSLKLVHLLDHKKTESLDIGKPLENSEQFSSLLITLHSLLSSFDYTSNKREIISHSLPELEFTI